MLRPKPPVREPEHGRDANAGQRAEENAVAKPYGRSLAMPPAIACQFQSACRFAEVANRYVSRTPVVTDV